MIARHRGAASTAPAFDFDATLWLNSLSSIGGGYALMSDRRLAFVVNECDGEALTRVMAQIAGQPERQEAVKHAIERRRIGEA